MNVINVNSLSAYNIIKENSKSYLIDVRTKQEHIQSGVPKIDSGLLRIEWRLPNMTINERFKDEFMEFVKSIDPQSLLFFICRSGGRSYEAASLMSKEGFQNCHNIVDGFEGSTWGAGWKQNNLPWQPAS